MKGCDYAWGVRPGHERALARALKREGFGFVVRYLSSDASKNLTRAEVRAYRAEGIKIVTVWEDAADAALGGAAAGTFAARSARRELDALGAPAHAPVYFAADFPVTAEQMPAVDAYLDATAFVLSEAENGVYGSYAAVTQARHCRYHWQTAAWSAGTWWPSDEMRQYAQGGVTNGVRWDLDVSLAPDFGQWEWPGDPLLPAVPAAHRARKAARAVRVTAGKAKVAAGAEPVMTSATAVAALTPALAFLQHHVGLYLTPAEFASAVTALVALAGAVPAWLTRPVRVGALGTVMATISAAAATFGLHLPAATVGAAVPLLALFAAHLASSRVAPKGAAAAPPQHVTVNVSGTTGPSVASAVATALRQATVNQAAAARPLFTATPAGAFQDAGTTTTGTAPPPAPPTTGATP